MSTHNAKNWKAIAEQVPGRDHVQCLQRWKKVLEPGLTKGQWTTAEDAELIQLVGRNYKNWTVLAQHMPVGLHCHVATARLASACLAWHGSAT